MEDVSTAARALAWLPIDTAPKDGSLLLFAPGIIFCGKRRYGFRGEPYQDTFAWRCDSSGRYGNPTHWMPLPAPPGGKE